MAQCPEHIDPQSVEVVAQRWGVDVVVRSLGGRRVVATAGALALLAIALVAAASVLWPGDWRSDDWVALAYTLLLSLGLLRVAQLLQHGQERRAAALADASLRTHIGHIVAESLLSPTLGAGRAVVVGQEACAALPLFRLASEPVQRQFLTAVERAYSSLTLNAFPSSHLLPISVVQQIGCDAEELVKELDEIRDDVGGQRPKVATALDDAGKLVTLCMALETWFRKDGDAPGLTGRALRLLYQEELRVYCCWADDRAKAATASVVKKPVRQLGACYSPWYLDKDSVQHRPLSRRPYIYKEANYSGKVRMANGDSLPAGAPASDDEQDPMVFVSRTALPTGDEPLTHDQVVGLDGSRVGQLAKMRRLLRATTAPVITVFVYTLETAGGGSASVVLDGNHRLAAALRWNADDATAIVFELREQPGASRDTKTSEHRAPAEGDKPWRGFTPDVGHVRALAEPRPSPLT